MNTQFNRATGFIGLTCFIFAADAPPAHAEDDTNKVRYLKVGVPIRQPSILFKLSKKHHRRGRRRNKETYGGPVGLQSSQLRSRVRRRLKKGARQIT